MMSLKPRNMELQETWATLKETAAGVVGQHSVECGRSKTRFSDVYALCVAHSEPLADKLYDETRKFLEEHVGGLLQRVKGSAQLESSDYNDGLLTRYVSAWREYSQGVGYLNSLYSYLNLQHVKRQKVSDAEIIYGSAATVSCPEHDSRQLEVGELGLVTWERVLVRPLATALSARLVAALGAARDAPPDQHHAHHDALRAAIHSAVEVQSDLESDPPGRNVGGAGETGCSGLMQSTFSSANKAAANTARKRGLANAYSTGRSGSKRDISAKVHEVTACFNGWPKKEAGGEAVPASSAKLCGALAEQLTRLEAAILETQKVLRNAVGAQNGDDSPGASDAAADRGAKEASSPGNPAMSLIEQYSDMLLNMMQNKMVNQFSASPQSLPPSAREDS